MAAAGVEGGAKELVQLFIKFKGGLQTESKTNLKVLLIEKSNQKNHRKHKSIMSPIIAQ